MSTKGAESKTAVQEDSKTEDEDVEFGYDRRCCHMPSWGRIFWCFYVVPMLALLLALALICYVPWFFSKRSLRPWLFTTGNGGRSLHGFHRAGHIAQKIPTYNRDEPTKTDGMTSPQYNEAIQKYNKDRIAFEGTMNRAVAAAGGEKELREKATMAASKRHKADWQHIGLTGRALTAKYGFGPEGLSKDYNSLLRTKKGHEQLKGMTGFHRQWRPTFWAFLIERTWQMYELLNEIWGTLERQGLQIWTVVGAITILCCQIAEMKNDFQGSVLAVNQATDPNLANSTLSVMGNSTADPDCAYQVGSGVANWHPIQLGTSENLVWYAMYHIMLLLMSFCLAVDATINVRFGVFAPQWNIAGHGYTMMFLVIATMTTSPNWGDTVYEYRSTTLRAIVLLILFIAGAYHVVLDIFLDMFGLEGKTHTESHRNQRHPLQPWKERNWILSHRFGHYDFRYDLKQQESFWGSRPCWTVRAQHWIGDRAIEMQRYGLMHTSEHIRGRENRDGRIAFVFQDDDIFLSPDQTYDDLKDSTIEGYFEDQGIEDEVRDAENLPNLLRELDRQLNSTNDMIESETLQKRIQDVEERKSLNGTTTKGINSQTGKQIRLTIKKNARGQIPTNGLQMIRGWPVQFPPVSFYDELLANPSHKVNGDMFWGNPDWHPMYYVSILAKYRAESSESWQDHETGKVDKLWSKVVYEWIPETVDGKVQEINDAVSRGGAANIWKRSMYKVFPITDRWRVWAIDYRRIWTMACAACLFVLHVYLLATVCSTKATVIFRAEYQKAIKTWQDSWGPRSDQCQYYKASYVPIYVFTKNDYYGVVIMQMMIFLWHYFLLGMLAAIFMVSLSNNRWWGMHCPVWLTLIGPRLSTNGVGWTLLFVVVATLQLGAYHDEPAGSWVLRIVCYISLACSVTYVGYLNEHMRQIYIRNPFWKLASKSPFVWIDQKKYEHAEQHKFGAIIDPKAALREYDGNPERQISHNQSRR